MGPLVDLTLGRCSSSNGYHRSGGSSSYPRDHMETLREAAQEYLGALKEERKKVEGFKRELPLCIELLDDAITTAEEKLLRGEEVVLPVALQLSCSAKENVICPTLEESMPLKRRERDQASGISSDGERESYCETKRSLPPPPPPPTQPAWMTSWNRTTSQSTEVVTEVVTEIVRDPEHSEQEQSSVTSSQQQRPAGAGAFVPFQLRELQQPHSSNAMPAVSRPTPRSGGFCADLNLCAHSERPAITSPSGLHSSPAAGSDVEAGSIQGTPASPLQQTPDAGNQSSGGGGGNSLTSNRKARRCWSPELHRRFVDALHQLGGSHIATPKQLRELMKVDGLTNDEVKSHLQKYRLHTRRPGSSSGPHESAVALAGQTPTSQLVVVGGIWMPPHHHASAVSPAAAAAAAAALQPGSHSGVLDPSQPPQFCHPTSLPLDYLAACINNGSPAGPPVQMLMHRRPIFESPSQAGTCQSQSSPQGPLQVTSQLSGATQGSSSETYESGEEEAKSQSASWKVCQRADQQPEAANQSMTVESSERSEPEPKKLKILKMHELDTAAASGDAAAHASTV